MHSNGFQKDQTSWSIWSEVANCETHQNNSKQTSKTGRPLWGLASHLTRHFFQLVHFLQQVHLLVISWQLTVKCFQMWHRYWCWNCISHLIMLEVHIPFSFVIHHIFGFEKLSRSRCDLWPAAVGLWVSLQHHATQIAGVPPLVWRDNEKY